MPHKTGRSESAWLRGYRARRRRAAGHVTDNDSQEAERAIAEAREKTGDTIARLMVAYVGFVAFCVFTLLSPDRLMIDPKASLNMPFAGTVSFSAFMVVALIVLIVMRVYLEVYVHWWHKLDRQLDEASKPKTVSPLKHPLLQNFSWIAIYPLLPLLLVLFTWKAAAKDGWGEMFLVLTSLSLLALFYRFLPWHWLARAAFIGIAAGLLSVPWLRGDELLHRGLDLVREDLKEAYLPGVNLRNAIATSADFTGADLTSANLIQADLAGANLTAANLTFADLTDADLTGANLTDADLSGIRMPAMSPNDFGIQWVTTLAGANFTRANLTGADLAVADLTGVNFQEAMNIPDLSRACADPDDPPINLPDYVKRPELWRRCQRFFWSMFW